MSARATPSLSCQWFRVRRTRALADAGSTAGKPAGHAGRCAACRAWLEQLTAIDEALGRAFAPPPPLPRGLEARAGIAVRRALAELEPAPAEEAAEIEPARPRATWRLPARAAAVVLALPVAGLGLWTAWGRFGPRAADRHLRIELPAGVRVASAPALRVERSAEDAPPAGERP